MHDTQWKNPTQTRKRPFNSLRLLFLKLRELRASLPPEHAPLLAPAARLSLALQFKVHAVDEHAERVPRTHRNAADLLLQQTCLEDGMCPICAWWVYHAVRLFGASSAASALHTAP